MAANDNRYLGQELAIIDAILAEYGAQGLDFLPDPDPPAPRPDHPDAGPHNARIRPDGTRADRESDAADAKDR